MSRLAKKPTPVPKGVEVTLTDGIVTVKGPKGTLTQQIEEGLTFTVSDGVLTFEVDSNKISSRLVGLYRSLIVNMIQGCSAGFVKELTFIGVGYRAAVQGQVLDVQVGYSHPVKLEIPQGIKVTVEGNTNVKIEGIDKQQVGQFAADVRAKRPPEPYKGKGVFIDNEHVVRKERKKAAAG